MKHVSNKVSFDELCRWAKVDTMEQVDDRLCENADIYGEVYGQALEDGMSEANAEATAIEAEASEREEQTNRYHDAVMGVCEQLFKEHRLVLEPVLSRRQRAYARKHPSQSDPRAYEFRVLPAYAGCTLGLAWDWNAALSAIRETINGVGMFRFESNAELLSSGPYTVRQAVLQHLHWVFDWPRVYEGSTARSMIERRLR